MNVTIFGSCVSRDILKLGDSDTSFKTNAFISFISPLSLMFEKGDYVYADGDLSWGTNWYKKNFMTDLNKTLYDVLNDSKSEYLLVDMGQIYYGIIEFIDKLNSSSSCTFSNSYSKNKQDLIANGSEVKLHRALDFSDEFLEQGMKKFCDTLKIFYDEKKIILIETYFAKNYIAKDGTIKQFDNENTDKINLLTQKANHFFLNNIDTLTVIKYDESLADENHVWGLGRRHYVKNFYTDRASQLREILSK